MDVFEQIKKDHKKIRVVLKEIDYGYENLSEIVPKLLNQLKYEISENIDLEEKVFYSFLKNSFEKHYFMRESLEDHQLIINLLNNVILSDFNRDNFNVLKDVVLKHFQKEYEIFSVVRCLLNKSQIDQLSSLMKIEKLKKYQKI